MDLYIFSVVLGAAGTAAMAFLGLSSSHGATHHAHDTSGHEMHRVGGHSHLTAPTHAAPHSHPGGWKPHLWTWLSPRVLFNFLVGFGATGLIVERLVGPVLALPIAAVGGIVFRSLRRAPHLQLAFQA